jgi:hypothetical protein
MLTFRARRLTFVDVDVRGHDELARVIFTRGGRDDDLQSRRSPGCESGRLCAHVGAAAGGPLTLTLPSVAS